MGCCRSYLEYLVILHVNVGLLEADHDVCYVSVRVYFARNSAALMLTKTKQISVFKQKQKETPEQKKKKKNETILENDIALRGIIYDI